MAHKTAKDFGYTHESIANLEVALEFDFVVVGMSIKRGDEFYTKTTTWVLVPDTHIGKVVASNFRPVRRRKRWVCWHLREDREKFCPVCSIFLRYITQRW